MRRPIEPPRWRWEFGSPSVTRGGGPERVVYDDPAPADWKPPPPVGFAPSEPQGGDLSASGPTGGTGSHGDAERPAEGVLTWEGDNA